MEKKKIEKEEIKKKTGGRKGLCLFENNNLINLEPYTCKVVQ